MNTISCILHAVLLVAGVGDETVSFPAPWASTYRVDPARPHHLIDDEGEHLFPIGKTAWFYFVCEDPDGVVRRARRDGANVLRVALEGRPYYEAIGMELWPWGGSREEPDYGRFDEDYWAQVERRVRLAGENGLGLDVVLYMNLPADPDAIDAHRPYWDEALRRLGKYRNVLTWEIANETLGNGAFQDAAGRHFAENDPSGRPVCTSDGTTDDAAWPDKEWVGLAINHSCTSSTYPLRDWYLAVARNTRSHGKPAWCNESGREGRHRNDDPIHRRKQGWLWCAAGAFWTYHAWDGCEGIDEADYRGPGAEFLTPMGDFFRSLPFWELAPTATSAIPRGPDLVSAVQTTPDRRLVVGYLCTEETGAAASGGRLSIRLPRGTYRVRWVAPAENRPTDESTFEASGLNHPIEVALPDFEDDLAFLITRVGPRDDRPIPGTQ